MYSDHSSEDMNTQTMIGGAETEAQPPLTIIQLSRDERHGIDGILHLYADSVKAVLPVSEQRRDMLVNITRLRENLALMETMKQGDGIDIDAASAIIVEGALDFFSGFVQLTANDDEQGQEVIKEVEDLKHVLLTGLR
jgi:hypothetical protein